MKNYPPFFLLAATVLVLGSGCDQSSQPAPSSEPGAESAWAPPPDIEPVRETSFAEVAAQLDAGGDVFGYLAVDTWLEDLSDKVGQWTGFLENMPDDQGGEKEKVLQAVQLVQELIQSSGLETITAIGLSGIQVSKDLHRTKFILHHSEGAEGFLLKLFGQDPHPLSALDLLPRTTVMAGFGDLNVAGIWALLEQHLAEAGIEELTRSIQGWPDQFKEKTGLEWQATLDSLGGELGMLVSFDETNTVEIPVEGQTVEFPRPALLLALKVRDDLIYERAAKAMAENPSTITTNEAGLKMSHMPVPVPLPFPVHAVLASNGEYLFLASSPELVRSVQAVAQGQSPGLVELEEFKQLAGHLDLEGTSFSYASPRFSQAFLDVQRQFVSTGQLEEDQLDMINKLLGFGEPSFGLSVGAHTATGWKTVSVGNQNSATMLLAVPVAMAAVVAGLTIPAIAKARTAAQSVQSRNQLKQLALAAHNHHEEHQALPPAASWCDALLPYLGEEAGVFKSPLDEGEGRCSYAFNRHLDGLALSEVDPRTVMVFSASGGWNEHGGRELLQPLPSSSDTYLIAFVDGSVRELTWDELDSLVWNPGDDPAQGDEEAGR